MGGREPGAEPVSPQQQLAERLAYDRGLDEGRRVAEAAAERRLHETIERLATQMTGAIGQGDARGDAVEQQGLLFFDTLARKIAGRAIERYPLGPVEELAAEAFRHLRGVPHIAVRVPPDLVEDVDRLLGGMARERGFEGRIIVLGDDAMTASDARIEWADGGLVRRGGRARRRRPPGPRGAARMIAHAFSISREAAQP